MAKYREILNKAKKIVLDKGLEESAVIELLLHFSKKESWDLYASLDDECTEEFVKEFEEGLDKYVNHNIPVQHITGLENFYGYDFIVSPDVLIPRFETEELVENILYEYDDFFGGKEVEVVDIGTGSGAIAISLAKEEKNMKLTATDISAKAIEVAKKNALNLDADVEFLVGDMLEPVKTRKFDILVSNPPYIPDDEIVDPLVCDNEPNVALFGGSDGLKFYRIILRDAKDILNKKNMMAFEHAYDKALEIKELVLTYFPDAKVKQLKDAAQKDRMTLVFNE